MTRSRVIPIVVYHKAPGDFGEQLAYIKHRGSIPAHLPEVLDYIETPTPRKYPEGRIVLTFDDAYRDFKETALPHLEGAGDGTVQFKATLCVPVGCISNGVTDCTDLPLDELMTWDELRDLAGHPLLQFIPHSVSHARFNQFDDQLDKRAQLEYQLGTSKSMLVERLSLLQEPLFFCLPGGAGWKTGEETDPTDRLVIDVLEQFGYKGALRAEYKKGEDWNQYCIPRCGADSLGRLRELLEQEFACKN